MNFPNLYRLRQRFDATRVTDPQQTVDAELQRLTLTDVKPGDRVAITAGSRGIDQIAAILGHVVRFFKDKGAAPFIFPAMGSHGGATAQGQRAILAHLGITQAAVGAPILSSMQALELGHTEDRLPVFIDKTAAGADHIVVVNRIKAHTKFKARIESGLMKMMAIGMGKQAGAELYHKAALNHTFPKIICAAGRVVLKKAPVLCGIGIVENGYGATAAIKAVRAAGIEAQEEELLALSKRLAPKLPFNDIDLLIVDEMGKNISGVGIDPNVTGRNRDLLGGFAHPVKVKRIFVRDLTVESNGNANGIGLADVTTDRLVAKIDFAATYKNAIAGISLEKAAIPMQFATDREAIGVVLDTLGLTPARHSKIVRIKNTARLDIVEVSEAYARELQQRPALEICDGPHPLRFDANGNLPVMIPQ